MTLLQKTSLVLLLLLGASLRLLDLTDPPLDFQPSRQLRNSLVARNIYISMLPAVPEEQIQLADSFARSVGKYEPPVIETLVAWSYLLTGGENYAAPRVFATFFWILAALALFDLMRRATSPNAALLALAYFLVLPFSVQASRSFQPDPLMTSAFVLGVYFLYRWSEEQLWKWALLAALFFSLAAFVKIVIAFFIGAAAAALVIFTLGKNFWKSTQVWSMALIMVAPAFIYYIALNDGRSTEYFFAWTLALLKLISSPTFYADWLGFLGGIFGLTALFAGIAGAFLAAPRLRVLILSLWAGYFLYGMTLPFQMYTHSYYHIQLIPIIALGLAAALHPLTESSARQTFVWRGAFAALAVVVVGYQAYAARSVLLAESFRHEPAFWAQIAEQIPPEAKVLALTQDYGYRLMLFGWRKVSLFPLSTELAQVRNGGMDSSARFSDLAADKDYFLVTAFGQLDKQPALKKILAEYPVAAQGDGYILYQLKK